MKELILNVPLSPADHRWLKTTGRKNGQAKARRAQAIISSARKADIESRRSSDN